MGIPGLTPLLLMLGFLAPVLLTTPEPMCDQRVMNKYIQDVSKAESEIVELCRTSCNLPEPVMVLDTGVNIRSWRKMNRTRQASEVWRGQTLLSRAISQVQRHHSAMQPFVRQLEVMESCLRSIRNILRGHGAQEAPQDDVSTRTLSVQTMKKLFSVYSSFIRGKVSLYITEACAR
ncbi:erythropoietin [Podarcis muralis]|uniref:erythropoietin isoform X2 n=1 Tax=Podarcis muralis TaxID=64176 RepID=UPI0010A0AB24|nr:erythropoietin isoform X2 [Podarcis muralis]XP_053217173.1 erythropoietin isoform X2 [Podarcis raffonei]